MFFLLVFNHVLDLVFELLLFFFACKKLRFQDLTSTSFYIVDELCVWINCLQNVMKHFFFFKNYVTKNEWNWFFLIIDYFYICVSVFHPYYNLF